MTGTSGNTGLDPILPGSATENVAGGIRRAELWFRESKNFVFCGKPIDIRLLGIVNLL